MFCFALGFGFEMKCRVFAKDSGRKESLISEMVQLEEGLTSNSALRRV